MPDPAVTNSLISAGSGLTGAIIGASATLLNAGRQHKAQLQAEAQREVRLRAVKAAEACDVLFRQLAVQVPKSYEYSRKMLKDDAAETAYNELAGKIAAAYEEVEAQTIHFRKDLAARLVRLRDIVRAADELTDQQTQMPGYGFHYASKYTIVRAATAQAHAVLVSYLLNEGEPPDTPLIVELDAAYDEYYADKGIEFAQEIAEDEEARRKWLERHRHVAQRLHAEKPGLRTRASAAVSAWKRPSG